MSDDVSMTVFQTSHKCMNRNPLFTWMESFYSAVTREDRIGNLVYQRSAFVSDSR